MKVFKSPILNSLYFGYRISKTIIDPINLMLGVYGYGWFIRDFVRYKIKSPKSKLLNINFYPILNEKISFTPVDAHYFYQQLWVFENVLKIKPGKHVDIGSTYQMSGYISKITRTIFLDYRPIITKLDNLEIMKGDILNLPFKDNSISSLSCLHVVEHIGLGRYGDTIDPDGSIKACKELSRVLAKNGYLYLSVPVGRYRICFNAHRVYPPELIVKFCKGLKLMNFSVVDDDGRLIENANYKKFSKLHYGCGLFKFTK